MPQDAVERVLGRLLTDERFRRLAKKSLEKACMQHGYSLTKTEHDLLCSLKLQVINEVAAQLDPGLCRAVTSRQYPPPFESATYHEECFYEKTVSGDF
ncbi:hypothetical protein SAMN05660860_02213 [Geoalkalibacter ferrihydriticus]|uniref:Uncharacterized protein n=1 Tax=Geoalkalibacter ferrihydriticus TaxID=392333 RepID=A0A1G9RQ77_9BACT|nr:hypothetical protein SAMN05660860_02213 [Geoalkalibacter ferrihydriticus]